MCPHHGEAGIVCVSQGILDAIKNKEAKTISEICYCLDYGEDNDDALEIPLFYTDTEMTVLPLNGYEADKEGKIKIWLRDEDDNDIEMFPHLPCCGSCFNEWESIINDRNNNYFIWGSVSNISKVAGLEAKINAVSSFVKDRKNAITPIELTEEEEFEKKTEIGQLAEEQAQEEARQQHTNLRKFFADKGLLAVEAFDSENNLIDREYRKNDFTAEGLELIHLTGAAWPNKLIGPSLKIDFFENALKKIQLNTLTSL